MDNLKTLGDALRTLGMVFLVILAVIGAATVFFVVTCLVTLTAASHQ